MVHAEAGGDEANTHGSCTRNQDTHPQKQEPLPVPPSIENLRKCDWQSLEFSPKRGIPFGLPSVPYRRRSPVHKRLASIVARATIVGTVKGW
jgi:hypothetical protein